VAINGHQDQSVAINGHPEQSALIRRSSALIMHLRGDLACLSLPAGGFCKQQARHHHHCQLQDEGGHQKSSGSIRGHQLLMKEVISMAISGHQLLMKEVISMAISC
jgi:hypothetical protein